MAWAQRPVDSATRQLVYVPEWGYEDIRRGYSHWKDPNTAIELVEEVRRLGRENPGNPDESTGDI